MALTRASFIIKDKKIPWSTPIVSSIAGCGRESSKQNIRAFGAMRCSFYLNQFETALTESGKCWTTKSSRRSSRPKQNTLRPVHFTKPVDWTTPWPSFKAITKTSKNVTGPKLITISPKFNLRETLKKLRKPWTNWWVTNTPTMTGIIKLCFYRPTLTSPKAMMCRCPCDAWNHHWRKTKAGISWRGHKKLGSFNAKEQAAKKNWKKTQHR